MLKISKRCGFTLVRREVMMKKNVAVAPDNPGISLIDENLLKSRICTICGVEKLKMCLTWIRKLCIL